MRAEEQTALATLCDSIRARWQVDHDEAFPGPGTVGWDRLLADLDRAAHIHEARVRRCPVCDKRFFVECTRSPKQRCSPSCGHKASRTCRAHQRRETFVHKVREALT